MARGEDGKAPSRLPGGSLNPATSPARRDEVNDPTAGQAERGPRLTYVPHVLRWRLRPPTPGRARDVSSCRSSVRLTQEVPSAHGGFSTGHLWRDISGHWIGRRKAQRPDGEHHRA